MLFCEGALECCEVVKFYVSNLDIIIIFGMHFKIKYSLPPPDAFQTVVPVKFAEMILTVFQVLLSILDTK